MDELTIGSLALGGTNIAEAIHKGLDCYQDDFPNYKAMLLITDGEDHEAFVKEATKRAKSRNVKIFTVGIGDQGEGRRIPVTDASGNRRFLQDADGNEIWSKMNPAVLQDAAFTTGGAYIPVGVGTTNLATIYRERIGSLEQKELEGLKEARYKDRYQWFLGLGLFLLMLEPLISTRKSVMSNMAL